MKNFTEHKINKDFAETRLDRWFRQYFRGLSHNELEKYLRRGLVKINGKKIKSNYRLNIDDVIKITSIFDDISNIDKKNIKITGSEDFIKKHTLYIDNDLLVLNKPYNLAVQGGTGIKRHLDGLLISAFLSKKITPRLVHRLDRETSGVLLVALSRKMAIHLSSLFKNKKVYKTYWAITEGSPKSKSGKINLNIEDSTKNNLSSLTLFHNILNIKDNISWIAFRPITGRTHQIRKHAAMSFFPIAGDKKYGKKSEKVKKFDKLHLHSHSVDFMDLNGDILHFEAPLPDHMMETWAKYNLPLKLESDFFSSDWGI